MKSKEHKEPKEKKKSEAKPRKSSEKGKRVPLQAVPDSEGKPVVASDWPIEQTNGAADGPGATTSPPLATTTSQPVAAGTELSAAEANPPEEMIRLRAYELFMERGCEHGRQLEDWFAAERELKLKYRSA